MMGSEIIGEEWNSEEFQIALKVVLKVEIQSLLERLSEAGEETVVLTACKEEENTGHLVSAKARQFVDSNDVSLLKDKFLSFLRGDKKSVGQSFVQGNMNLAVAKGFQAGQGKGPIQQAANQKPQPQKGPVKRPAEPITNVKSIQPVQDQKRQKIETPAQQKVGQMQTRGQVQANQLQGATKQQQQSQQKTASATSLKTTKVVSKSGGFTEERLSDAEFQKFLQRYKTNYAEDEELDEEDEEEMYEEDHSALMPPPSAPLAKTGQKLQNPIKSTSQGSVLSAIDKTKTGNVMSKCVSDAKKDTINNSKMSINSQNKPLEVQRLQKAEGGKVSPIPEKGKEKNPVMNKSKEGQASKSDQLEDIEKMDTETLIRLTKQKCLENMSPAEREIHDKLSQLSSKLSWVVENPSKSGEGGNKAVSQMSQSCAKTMANIQQQDSTHQNMEMYAMMDEIGEEEYDEEEDDDEDGEFDENDLDEEDRAKLHQIREEQMKQLDGMMAGQYEDEEAYDEEEEGYGEEGMQGYEEYEEMGLTPMEGESVSMGSLSQDQQYAQANSPTMDNFLMMGPSIAKCHLCNKMVRIAETKQHLETHAAEYELEEEVEEEEDEVENEDYEDEEGYEEFEGEDYEEGPEFTAEKIDSEQFIAEKIVDDSDSSGDMQSRSGKSLFCDICGKNFKSHSKMLRHRQTHVATKDFMCPVCPKTFKLQVYLTRHLRKAHKEYTESNQDMGEQGEEEGAQAEEESNTETNT